MEYLTAKLFLCGLFFGTFPIAHGQLDFNKTINDIVQLIPDPLELPIELSLPLEIEGIINGQINVTNPKIAGLHGLLIPYVSGLLSFVLDFPQIEVNIGYGADLDVLGLLSIYGNGDLGITLNNLQITGSFGIDLSKLQLQDLWIKINLEELEISISGLNGDESFSELVSTLITGLGNSLIVSSLNDNADEIAETISPILQDIINSILNPPPQTTDSVDPVLDEVVKRFKEMLSTKMHE